MNCMKCGSIIAADQVFCEDCLAEMEKYPVPQETPVTLPPRDDMTAPKRSSVRRFRKPENKIATMKAIIWVLLILLTALLIAFIMVVSTLTQVLNIPKDLPETKQSYTQCVDKCFT